MNTTDLVHFSPGGARSASTETRLSPPPSYHELFGPVRQAIVRARLDLLARQTAEGSWEGRCAGDVTLLAQSVLLRAYLGDPLSDSEAEAYEAAILAHSLAEGGWARRPGGALDVSASVQAYFALKACGREPNDPQMAAARRQICRLGGAEKADGETRRFLVALGQAPLSTYACDGEFAAPVRTLAAQHGIRELFWRHGTEWPTRTESALSPRSVNPATLSFPELVRRRIELAGRNDEPSLGESKLCEISLRRLRGECETLDADLGGPALRSRPIGDTAAVLAALGESGMSLGHEAVARASNWLRAPQRRDEQAGDGEELSALAALLVQAAKTSAACAPLPPDLQFASGGSVKLGTGARRGEAIARSAAKLRRQLAEQILARQQADGRWGEGTASSASATAQAMIALGAGDEAAVKSALERGRDYLLANQCGDGGWEGAAGAQRVEATALAVRALRTVGMPVDGDAVGGATNWLLAYQLPCGAWGEPLENDSPEVASPATTSAALLALVDVGAEAGPAARRAVAFLVASQTEEGGWEDETFSFYDASVDRFHGNSLATTAVTLTALSRWLIGAARREAAAPAPVSLKLFRAPNE